MHFKLRSEILIINIMIFLGLTSVAMAQSLLSSAMTNTDWYMESLEEHIVDILHSGFSL